MINLLHRVACGKCLLKPSPNRVFYTVAMMNANRGRIWAAACPSRSFGGYIEDAQLTLYGIEIYSDLYGADAAIPPSFIVPTDDARWPHILWNYDLGQGIEKHVKYINPLTLPDSLIPDKAPWSIHLCTHLYKIIPTLKSSASLPILHQLTS